MIKLLIPAMLSSVLLFGCSSFTKTASQNPSEVMKAIYSAAANQDGDKACSYSTDRYQEEIIRDSKVFSQQMSQGESNPNIPVLTKNPSCGQAIEWTLVAASSITNRSLSEIFVSSDVGKETITGNTATVEIKDNSAERFILEDGKWKSDGSVEITRSN